MMEIELSLMICVELISFTMRGRGEDPMSDK